jgi:diguanylate cyclase (GGDEF)-like protein/PAS domain S-box-containing protein
MPDIKTNTQTMEVSPAKSETIRVLLIEDNPGDARLVKEMLVGTEVYRFSLEHVERISEGLVLVGRGDFHVILLDLSLPDGQGLETVKKVCLEAPGFPVIILTGLADETIAIQSVKMGAQDYLVKGQMDGNLLGRAIRYAIERKRAGEELRESEEKFRQLAENIREVFYVYEQETAQFLYISPGYESIWGRTCKSLYQNPNSFWEAIHPEDRDRGISPSAKRSQEKVDEVYRIVRLDGSIRWIIDHSYPVLNESRNTYRIVGIAADITDLKLAEEKLRYLGLHDSLTGLYNRAYFEEEMHRIEKARYESVGIVTCDLDGLKVVNDTFGHDKGDTLLQAAATVLRKAFRREDVVARTGGDEFSVILPNATQSAAERSCERVQEAITRYNNNNPEVPLSLSIGVAVRKGVSRSMRELFKEADNEMYRKKLYRAQSIRSGFVRTLMKTLRARDPVTEEQVCRLEKLLIKMAVDLGVPETTQADIRLLAQFHDIGKIAMPDRILFKEGVFTPEERREMERHCEIGYRIAQSAPDLVHIAEWILKHHEWWNGQGYPLGLKGEEIPVESRILSICDAYEAMTSFRPYRKPLTHQEAVAELLHGSGTQFDPKLLEKFLRIWETNKPESASERPKSTGLALPFSKNAL